MNGSSGSTWLDDLAAINAIALLWWREVTQPQTTSSGSVTVGGSGISAALSPGLIIAIVVLGIAVIYIARK